MPITNQGWELLIRRTAQHKRANKTYARTVGTYQVYRDGSAVEGLSGMIAERQGPGDNGPSGVTQHRRIAAGRYGLATHDGSANNNYQTIGYSPSTAMDALPRPCLRFLNTGSRSGILIHPGAGYLYSIGCFNPGTQLSGPDDNLAWLDSRRRVIAIIDDLRAYLGQAFPGSNNVTIPRAHAVVEGEPS